ncbi:MAG: UDP-N-acetylmuramate--L-alanine ligase [Lachnospiraceae bacterium]|nr:UDP-N-acetylmuramate--L-alanine ligase [Lachnospiraceae bacterium]
MFRITFSNPVSIHFIGIGGISMSALAELLHAQGFRVSGSDLKESPLTKRLESLGITVSYPQQASNISESCSVVIYTAAVHSDNPEMVRAKELGLPILERKDLLGQLMQQYRHVAGIAGSHGKTSTTSMLSLMLMEENLDPTILVGGVLDGIGGNLRIGNRNYLVAEACEYCNSFLSFYPTDAIILNIEAEHLDFFRDLDDIRNSFRKYSELLPDTGTLVINGDIEHLSELTDGLAAKILTYGLCDTPDTCASYDYAATNCSFDKNGFGSYDLYERGTFLGRLSLRVIGMHNISNSVAAAALAFSYGVSFDIVAAALLKYTGTHRRFEYKGTANGIRVYDDYAHHPSEISATLSAARACVSGTQKLWCTFQPHTFSRTKAFLHEFAESLSLADTVVLADIYSASRETDPGDISSADIMALLKEKGKEVYHFHSFEEIEKFLFSHCNKDDLLITMGAGDIVNVAESMILS